MLFLYPVYLAPLTSSSASLTTRRTGLTCPPWMMWALPLIRLPWSCWHIQIRIWLLKNLLFTAPNSGALGIRKILLYENKTVKLENSSIQILDFPKKLRVKWLQHDLPAASRTKLKYKISPFSVAKSRPASVQTSEVQHSSRQIQHTYVYSIQQQLAKWSPWNIWSLRLTSPPSLSTAPNICLFYPSWRVKRFLPPRSVMRKQRKLSFSLNSFRDFS